MKRIARAASKGSPISHRNLHRDGNIWIGGEPEGGWLSTGARSRRGAIVDLAITTPKQRDSARQAPRLGWIHQPAYRAKNMEPETR